MDSGKKGKYRWNLVNKMEVKEKKGKTKRVMRERQSCTMEKEGKKGKKEGKIWGADWKENFVRSSETW